VATTSGPELILAIRKRDARSVADAVRADRALLNFTDRHGLSAIHWAALSGDAGLVGLLLDLGADPNREGFAEGERPIHCAAQDGHTEVVRLLLAKGVPVDGRGGNRNTPLHTAARDGHFETVDLLIASGADVEARCEDASTPLDLAARKNHVAVIERLLGAGASTGVQNNKGATPLHYAAFQGSELVASALLARGALVQYPDRHGIFGPNRSPSWNAKTIDLPFR